MKTANMKAARSRLILSAVTASIVHLGSLPSASAEENRSASLTHILPAQEFAANLETQLDALTDKLEAQIRNNDPETGGDHEPGKETSAGLKKSQPEKVTEQLRIEKIVKFAREHPAAVEALVKKRGFAELFQKDPAGAIALGNELIESQKDNAELLNGIAWSLVDPENPIEKPNLDLALKAALRAAELTKGEDSPILDTLARVHFNRGDIDKAVELQTKAGEKAGAGAQEGLNRTLSEYKAKMASAKSMPASGPGNAVKLDGRSLATAVGRSKGSEAVGVAMVTHDEIHVAVIEPANSPLNRSAALMVLSFAELAQKDRAALVALIEAEKDDSELLNDIAWSLVNPENPIEKPNLDLALKAAHRANELAKGEVGPILDTLARVHFNRGDIDKAVELQTKAVEKADAGAKEGLKRTLSEYKAKMTSAKSMPATGPENVVTSGDQTPIVCLSVASSGGNVAFVGERHGEIHAVVIATDNQPRSTKALVVSSFSELAQDDHEAFVAVMGKSRDSEHKAP